VVLLGALSVSGHSWRGGFFTRRGRVLAPRQMNKAKIGRVGRVSDKREKSAKKEELQMFALTRLRLPIAVIGAVVFSALLAFAAFSSAVQAHQADAAEEQTDAAATKEQTDAATKEDGVTTQFHAWENYHWARTSNPFSLKLGDNVTSAWDSYLRTASSDWSQSTVLDTTTPAGNVSSRDLKRKKCPPKSGQVEVCNATYGATGWSGLAQIWIAQDPATRLYTNITAGVANMNDTYFGSGDTAKRAHVMCQEIGHTFGLGHTSEDGSSQGTCMDYSRDSTNSQHPYPHDYEELERIYQHLDSTSTVGTISQMPAAAKRGNYNNRSEWGKLKHKSPD
jgi:hypothetical protein